MKPKLESGRTQIKAFRAGVYASTHFGSKTGDLTHGIITTVGGKLFLEVSSTGECFEIVEGEPGDFQVAKADLFRSSAKEKEAYDSEVASWVTEPEPEFESEPELDTNVVRLKPDHSRYTRTKETKTPCGRSSYDVGDPVAIHLRGLTPEDLFQEVVVVLSALDVDAIGRGKKMVRLTIENLQKRYGNLNVGMQRMNCGNLIRAASIRWIKSGKGSESDFSELLAKIADS